MVNEAAEKFIEMLKINVDYKYNFRDKINTAFNDALDWYLDDTEKYYNELTKDDFSIISKNASNLFLNSLIEENK